MRCEILEQIKRLPIKALKFFYFVAEYGSVTMAAEKLSVTHSAVSKQIKLLEQYFAEALFVKSGRNLVLSATGQCLYETCQAAFNTLELGLQKINKKQNDDLVVSCEPTLAMKWLIPRMAQFQAEYQFNLVVLAAGGQVDFKRHTIDIALRRNDFIWSQNLYAEKIADEYMGPVHIPNLTLKQKLHTYTRPRAWQDWMERTGIDFPLYHDVFFERFFLALQGALGGVGVALVSQWMVEQEINQGILQAPYGFIPDGSAYYLLSETDFTTHPKKMLFLQWIRKEMAKMR
ncbi:LysR family transcriptional regulator [Pasteurella canis]|nr:LysR family transcriptional regulator [Pasteurella canis]UEC22430.1 LysR family transcriptional regulator [Pasteurella canis]